ncbi:hypothetical protein J8B39_22925 [Vibrio parahaemolyticus]|nr:hypothetical protein [Vibrio parahaemolyticus]MBM5096411.1 hypothetical protein [Vibrio parahaemolyticus]MBM5419142.1 hypothetical protein [Vibrio parahaemolyticus]MCF9098791.1 hypothetical protein [Vibrio parahaemolyticus]MCF9116882.1 hypothetical protein [Vibrio parahaemolyticus]
MKKLMIASLLLTPLHASASSLSDISQFATEICDKIEAKGSVSSSQIEAALHGNAGTISRLIGAKVTANGSILINNSEYEGIPYEELSVQMLDSRNCKKDLAFALLEKSRVVQQSTAPVKSSYVINAQDGAVVLLAQPSFQKRTESILSGDLSKQLLNKTPVELLQSNYVEDVLGTKVQWSKVRILAGTNSGSVGWVLTNDVSFK